MQLSKISQLLGKGIARHSVVLFFLGFGLVKFTTRDGDSLASQPAPKLS